MLVVQDRETYPRPWLPSRTGGTFAYGLDRDQRDVVGPQASAVTAQGTVQQPRGDVIGAGPTSAAGIDGLDHRQRVAGLDDVDGLAWVRLDYTDHDLLYPFVYGL